jgi:hypothetical protein
MWDEEKSLQQRPADDIYIYIYVCIFKIRNKEALNVVSFHREQSEPVVAPSVVDTSSPSATNGVFCKSTTSRLVLKSEASEDVVAARPPSLFRCGSMMDLAVPRADDPMRLPGLIIWLCLVWVTASDSMPGEDDFGTIERGCRLRPIL